MRCGSLAVAMALWTNPSLSSRIEFVKSANQLQPEEPTPSADDDPETKYAMKCGGEEGIIEQETGLLQETENEAPVNVESSFLEDHEVSDLFMHLSASAANGRARSVDYDCSMSEWNSFNSQFHLGWPMDTLPANWTLRSGTHNPSTNGREYFYNSATNTAQYANPLAEGRCEATKHKDFQDKPVCSGGENVVFMYPWVDDTNAFCVNDNVCHRLSNWDKNACSVKMLRIKNVQHGIDQLDQYPDNSIKHAVLGGHGSGGTLHWGDGNTCGESHICVGNRLSNELLKKLTKKMLQHGTIFLDSCLSSTTDESKFMRGKNLATWAAGEVGKGIRVIGSVLSFGKVRVTRFKAWYAQIDVKDEKGVQRTSFASGARCPSWAERSVPDSDGECKCPGTCRTTDGGKCPSAKGKTSDRYFLPVCAEDWSKVKCQCV